MRKRKGVSEWQIICIALATTALIDGSILKLAYLAGHRVKSTASGRNRNKNEKPRSGQKSKPIRECLNTSRTFGKNARKEDIENEALNQKSKRNH